MAIASKMRDFTPLPQFGIGGTDLGIMFRLPNGNTGIVFGDTFERNTVGGPGWRSPVMVVARGHDLSVTGAVGGNYAKQLRPYSHENNLTYLPADAITIGDRSYLWVMRNQGLHNVVRSEIWFSDDNGNTWEVGPHIPAKMANGYMQCITWELHDNYVYIMSTGFQRNKGIILHRALRDRLFDVSAYEPWGFRDGLWRWGNPATVILPGRFGELSLRRIDDQFVLLAFDELNYRIEALVFPSPISDLTTAPRRTLIQGSAWHNENHSRGRVAQLYGPYIDPNSTLHSLRFMVSQWNTNSNWPYKSMLFSASLTEEPQQPQAIRSPSQPLSLLDILRRLIGR